MLVRQVARGAYRPIARASSSPLARLPASGPSVVALGKRPALHGPHLLAASPVLSRSFSFTPWRTKTPAEMTAAEAPTAEAASAIPHEPILTQPHPDLQPTGAASNSAPIEPVAPVQPVAQATEAVPDLPPAGVTDPSLFPQSPALPNVPSLEELVTNATVPLSDILNSPEAVHAAVKLSDLKLIGLEHGFFGLSGWARDALVSMHTLTGLPWWGSIAALTICLRLCLFPLIVRNQKHNIRMQAVQPQMTALFKRLADAKKANDAAATQTVGQSLVGLMKEHDVSPFRSLALPLIQAPFFLSMFWGLEKLATTPLPQLKEGGFGWVTDLTMSDPYYILPTTSMVLTNLVFRFGADGTGATASGPNGMDMRHVRNFIGMASIIAIPLLGRMPAAVLFYWTFTNAFTLLQALTLRSSTVKSLLRIRAPPKVAASPDAKSADPTWFDTVNAIKKHFTDTWAKTRENAAQMQLEQMEKQRKLKKGQALFVDRVKEGGAGESKSSDTVVRSESFMETEQPSPAQSATLTREQVKRQRVEAARERRARH